MSSSAVDLLFIGIIFFIFGAAFGSFACCQAWRLRLRQKGSKLGSRSVCLHCKYQLKWYDNIPLFSWLILKGHCRKCKKPIGRAEVLSEFCLGLVFALLGLNFFAVGLFTPVAIAQFIILMAAIIGFWVLLIYDARWGQLPTKALIIVNLLAITYAILGLITATDFSAALLSLVVAIGLLAGIYYLLYFFSRESLVGSGDWLLCLAIAAFLGHWWLAIIELFLANFFAAFVSLPAFFKKGRRKIFFGPFLIGSFILVFLLRTWLMSLI